MQIGEESIENLLVNMVLEKKIKIQIWKDLISCLFTWEWTKHIPIWNCPSDNYDLWNLMLSYQTSSDESSSLVYGQLKVYLKAESYPFSQRY
jgi:hypothetical protein